MDRPKCKTCPYWADTLVKPGQCRRMSPDTCTEQADQFPVMYDDGWCGEHPEFPAWIEANKKGQGNG